MATIKINSINKRKINLTVVWANGLTKTLDIDNAPVESKVEVMKFLNEQVGAWYITACQEAAELAHANPVPDPLVTAAVGHTFADDGTLIA